MFRRLVYLSSLCIFNKNKRKFFQERCFKHKKNIEQIDMLKAKLEELDILLAQQSRFIARQGGVLFADCKRHMLHILMQEKEIVAEHIKNENELYRNLDDEAKIHLDEIIDRKKRCARSDIISFDELFAQGNDKKQWRALQEFEQEVVHCENYYAYKHYNLPIDCFEPEVFLYKHGIDRLKTFNSMSDKAIVDVGGFVGDTLLILREYSDNDIYSFEPDPTNYSLASKTLELNKHILSKGGSIILENIALGDSDGRNKIITPSYNGSYIGAAARLVGENEEEGTDVAVRTLDSYVAEHNIKVGMIKVDIEGYEQRFLFGALETIKTQKPILLISIYHNRDDFYQIKPFIENLDLGYKFDFFQGVNRWVMNDVMLLCEVY